MNRLYLRSLVSFLLNYLFVFNAQAVPILSSQINTPGYFFYSAEGNSITSASRPLEVSTSSLGLPWGVDFIIIETPGFSGGDELTIVFGAKHQIKLHSVDGSDGGGLFDGTLFVVGEDHKDQNNVDFSMTGRLSHGGHYDEFDVTATISRFNVLGDISNNPPDQIAYRFNFQGVHLPEPSPLVLFALPVAGMLLQFKKRSLLNSATTDS